MAVRQHVRELALSNFPAVYNRDFSVARYISGYVLTQNSHFTHAPVRGNPPGDRVASCAILRFINVEEHKIVLCVIPRSGKVSLKGPTLMQKVFSNTEGGHTYR